MPLARRSPPLARLAPLCAGALALGCSTAGSGGPRPSDSASSTSAAATAPPTATGVAASRASHPIVIYGDTRTGDEVHRKVVAAIRRVEPAMVFHTGDLVVDGTKPELWITFDAITGELRREAPFYPVLGNHERGSPLYFEHFELPNNERWYAVDTPLARFLVLDNYSPLAAGSEQRSWLDAELARRSPKPVVVLEHQPFFSTGHHGGSETLQRELLPVLEAGGVAAVFAGHDHDYERSLHHGVVHVVAGGGGAPLYQQDKRDPRSVKFVAAHHFCVLTAAERGVHVEARTPEGETLDSFDFGAGPTAPASASAPSAP
ncbi:MAG: metallophosphoesterase [Polyangiaceae bacterium]|nr:metallophosphoesterase [Polyangiaceae bacterium]